MSKKIIRVHTGALPIFLAATTSRKACERELKQRGYKDFKSPRRGVATTTIATRDRAIPTVIVTLQHKIRNKTDLAGICAHEACHVFDAVLDTMDEDKPGEEMRAYIVQWITSFLFGAFSKLQ